MSKRVGQEGKLSRSIHSGRVVTSLREAIVSGRLKAGDSLVEATLASELGVSRGPVRNALLELKGEGLVETSANGRAYVTGFERRHLVDLFAVRLEHEFLAVRWGIERRASPAGVLAAHAALEAETGLSSTRMAEVDLTFHRALLEFSGSRSLLRAWLALAPVITTVIAVANRRVGLSSTELHALVRDLHVPIVEAVVARDLKAAKRCLEEHFERLHSSYPDPESPAADGEATPLS